MDHFPPALATVLRDRHDLGKFLGLPQHHVRTDRQAAVREFNNSVGFEAHDPAVNRSLPGFPLVPAPPELISRRLVFMEMPIIVEIADDYQAPIAELTDARGSQTFLATPVIGRSHLFKLEPGAAEIIAGEQR